MDNQTIEKLMANPNYTFSDEQLKEIEQKKKVKNKKSFKKQKGQFKKETGKQEEE